MKKAVLNFRQALFQNPAQSVLSEIDRFGISVS